MSNERECLARQWAENFKADILYDATMDELAAASEHILATTNPPTMDKVAWDVEKHVLAGARLHTDNDEQVDVVMLAKDVSIIDYATLDGKPGYEHCSYFTPNGKRYELLEVTDKPECPETLSTLEDYENAPIWTIVTTPVLGLVYLKVLDGKWVATACTVKLDSIDLVEGNPGDSTMSVLRWGLGD